MRSFRLFSSATASFVMTLDSVNFGSGWFPHLRKRPGMSGYHTVATSLHDLVRRDGPVSPAWLRRVGPTECARIFGQDPEGGPTSELMGHFAVALNELGRFVDRVGDGRFGDAVAAAGDSAAAMVELLSEMPYYRDVHEYRGHRVKLLKRAQITPYDLAVAFDFSGPGRFADLDQLTIFADNLVPHVLRVEGVLVFADSLVARIEAVDDIGCGSEPEVEIRACGLHAVELLVAELRARRPDITPAHLDGVLWRRGGRARYKAIARHRARGVYY
ncbi:MAG: queuosine salvage family protein [Acidimicrobiales bacterium]